MEYATGGDNVYVYTSNNPLKYIDPSGMVEECANGKEDSCSSQTTITEESTNGEGNQVREIGFFALPSLSDYLDGTRVLGVRVRITVTSAEPDATNVEVEDSNNQNRPSSSHKVVIPFPRIVNGGLLLDPTRPPSGYDLFTVEGWRQSYFHLRKLFTGDFKGFIKDYEDYNPILYFPIMGIRESGRPLFRGGKRSVRDRSPYPRRFLHWLHKKLQTTNERIRDLSSEDLEYYHEEWKNLGKPRHYD